ncbi:vacuolar protein sorting-associated protein 16 [Mytilinidion resinicola]|uniref:Probable vacuolar protein sorting-associated protein 16 homolog n=1 Tax=Mytilinidion resinicola TaxID=574789 RepID=A0A6A6YCC1_9PEZI|nr:vacuolar protein sorting-associated protein 16 [Mytilinidion resinicola]KAF2806461.1 vacuolar protein sorting-associated protein 16 [Mytilinidion resinicola]
MSKPTANWEKVGDKFYRKVPLYKEVFDLDLELENYKVVGAPYSGAVAIYRDEDKIHSYRGTQGAKSSIDIYSCAGSLIRRINWDKGSIKGLGWSEDEKLLVVTEDGTVRCYYDLQGDFTPFTLGHGAEDHGVLECRFWSSGFVALLGNNHLIAVNRYDEPRPKLLAIPPTEPVVSWSIIPPAYSLSRSVEVILAIGKTLFVIDATDAEDRDFTAGPFQHISVSPRGEFLAFYTEDGKVWVVSGDWTEKLSEYNSKAKTVPKDMQWCGSNAVALAWEDEVHLIGPRSVATKFYYDAWIHLLPDMDGIRLLTNDVCEYLQKVPDVTEEVFRLGSESPAAYLLEAAEQLEKKSPKADDLIQLIRPNLAEAVDTCVKAAGHEFNIHWQKQLLKAASFGKSVLDLYSSDDFVDMCETLRVLNAARFYEIGLPLSYDQYKRLTPEKLIERLINRHEYLLALRISDYLHLPTDKIYVHWASQKVRVSIEDEESICRLIVQKLHGKAGVSFEEIARAAYDEGRARLATELLNYEPRAGKQVPLLLGMKEDTIALDKAIESGDTDLIYHVLLHLRKKLPLASFFRTINSRPVATALVESSARYQDRELLKDLYYQDDRRLDGANLLIAESLNQTNTPARIDKLKLASKLLQDSRENAFAAKAIDDTAKLLRMQDTFEKDLGPGFVGLSINETIFNLVKAGHTKRAAKVQSEFKVPEHTFWWVRLRALVAARHWNELESLGQQRKSPIGWEPFFNEILGAGNTRVASGFIPKCTGLSVPERIEMWVKCGLVVKAGEEALKAKNRPALEELRAKASGTAIAEIERLIGMLPPVRK